MKRSAPPDATLAFDPKDLRVSMKTDAQKGQTLVRGLDIIEAVAHGASSIQEVAAATALTYPTVHRLVSVLIDQGYLRARETRGLSLGRKLMELGFAAHARIDLVQEARPILQALSNATRDTVHLAQRDGLEVVYLDKLPGARAVQISSRIGGRKPVISTGVGKALLLDDAPAQWAEIYDIEGHRLPATMDKARWLSMMQDYHAKGFAYDLGEDEYVIRCVSAPLRDASGRIVAAISVSSTLDNMPQERMLALIQVVMRAAEDISSGLGYRFGAATGPAGER